MTCIAPVNISRSEPASVQAFEALLKSLPQRRDYKRPWHQTRRSPCPLLIQCTVCKQFLLPTDFYTLKKSVRIAKRDILRNDHASACIACAAKEYPLIDSRRKLFYASKKRAKEKGLSFEITVEDIVIPKYCPVFGIELKAAVGGGTVSVARLENSPTLDRIDNAKGYTPDNIAVISLRANNLKRDATLYEMQCLAFHMENPVGDAIVDRSELMNQITAETVKGVECSVHMANYYRTDHRTKLIRAANRRSKIYGSDGPLTPNDIVIPEYCPVLGIKLYPSVGRGLRTLNNFYHSPSIDRIDSSKGYSKENIQVISFRANCLKRDATLEEVKAMVRYMETSAHGSVVLGHPFSNDTNGGLQ